MDESIVRSHIEQLRYVPEKTSHLEITLHTDPEYDTNIEEPLTEEEISDWVNETGRFTPKALPDNVKKIATLRFILQTEAQNPHTFDANTVSLPTVEYIELLEACRLSTRAVDSASVVGPLFWFEFDHDDEVHRGNSDLNHDITIRRSKRNLRVIFRNTDSGMINIANGFQLIMSHKFHQDSSVVLGFYKATENTEIATNVMHIRRSTKEIAHPMLLPVMLLSSNIGPKQENRQKKARAMLHIVEDALFKHLVSTGPSSTSLENINIELMKCHSNVWKTPASSHKLIDGVERVLNSIKSTEYHIENPYLIQRMGSYTLNDINDRYMQRVNFIRDRLRGIESYCHTTLSKIDVQRTALHNLLLHRQNETALHIERRQQLEAERKFSESQTWNMNQRTISLLGIFFLPGAFIASICSTTFFNFQAAPGQTVVSDHFWIFWAFTVPSTLLVLAVWWMKERLDKARAERLGTKLATGHLKTM